VKVLHLLKTSIGATWALRQMRELVKLGGSLIDMYEKFGVVVHKHDISFTFDLLKMRRRILFLRQVVEKYKPDIIHSHFVSTTMAMRLALRHNSKIPRIFQVPGPLHLEHYFFRSIEIKSAGLSDYWIASCEFTKNLYIKAGIPKEHLFLSYYGVNINEFVPIKKKKFRTPIQKIRDAKLIGIIAYMYAPKWYIGQRRGLKGHEDLIDAIAICLKKGLNIRGVMIGGAWNNAKKYEEKVSKYACKKCGSAIEFLGTRKDVVDLYKKIDVVVHPSHSENVGGAVESLLLARPTITTNVGGFPDLVKNGLTGYLVPPKNPKALADKIEYVVNNYDEALRLAKNGQALCKRMFDVRKNAEAVYKAYKIITKNHSDKSATN
jgi:glycosyltransferase involved in cell wall biosynthesis